MLSSNAVGALKALQRMTVVRLLAAAALLVTGLAPWAVSSARAADFVALEIFDQEPLRTPQQTPCQGRPQCRQAALDRTQFPANIPQPSLAQFVVTGTIQQVVTDARGTVQRWRLGSGADAVWLFRSQAGTRLDRAPAKGDLVRAIAKRSTAKNAQGATRAAPLVADRITRRGAGTTAPPEAEVAFLYNGLVTEAGDDTWTIGGVEFGLDGPEGRAEIEPETLGEGDRVTVEFDVAPPGSGGGGEVPPGGGGGTASGLIALEIFDPEPLRIEQPGMPCEDPAPAPPPGPSLPLALIPPLGPDAPELSCEAEKYDNTSFPAEGFPRPSLAQLVVTGTVTEVEPAGGTPQRWKLSTPGGDQAVWLFSHADTRLDNNPQVGDLVRAIAQRTTEPGPEPWVLDRLTRRGAGTAGAPEKEIAFLFNGEVTDAGNDDTWTIGGFVFSMNGPEGRAEVDPPTIGVGDPVTVEFMRSADLAE